MTRSATTAATRLPAWTLGIVLAPLAVFFVWPLALVLEQAADAAAWRWVVGDYARSRIGGAVLQALLSIGATFAIAVPLAVLHQRWAIPGSRALLAVHAATFALPVFVVVAGLRATLGGGGWFEQATGIDALGAIGPWGSVILANAYYNTGLAALLLHGALRRRPRRLEDAAASLGAPPTHVTLRVSGPLLRPAFVATALLTFLFCFSSFGVVLLLGEGRIDTLDTLLYANLGGAFPQTSRGAVLAVVQLATQGALVGMTLMLDRRARRLDAEPEPRPRARKSFATAVAWTAAALALLPALAVLIEAFHVGDEWSMRAWTTLFDEDASGHLFGFTLRRALILTIAYAAGAAALSLALALVLGYAARGAFGRLAEAVAFLPLGTSSVVLGFAFLLAFTGRTWLPLAGTPWLVVVAHTLVAFPFVARALLPALRSLDPRLDEAAVTLGARAGSRFRRLHLSVLRAPIATACAFAAVLSLGDYGASLLLMTDDVAGLSVWIGRHGGPGSFDPLARAQSTALAALLLMLTLAILAMGALAAGRRRPA